MDMKSVSFKNFRNFEDFPMLPVGGVTFLVGQNNSGKSTFTKAFRFLSENMEKCCGNWFSIDTGTTKTPIVSFASTCKSYERALFAGHKETMEFCFSMSDFNIRIKLATPAENENQKIHDRVELEHISIEDIENDFIWSYDFTTHQTILEYSGQLLSNMLRYMESEFRKKNEVFRFDTFIEGTEYVRKRIKERNGCSDESFDNMLQSYKEKLQQFQYEADQYAALKNRERITIAEQYLIQHPLDMSSHYFMLKNGDMALYDFDNILENRAIESTDGTYMDAENALIACEAFFKHEYTKLLAEVKSTKVVYCAAHESPLRSFFEREDTSGDYATSLIQQFYNSEYYKRRKKWVCRWMQELKIGMDFEIRLVNSEFLGVEVTNTEGYVTLLSDLGRGSVQLFLMLLRVSLLERDVDIEIRERVIDDHVYEVFTEVLSRPLNTIIFEEPEQNLHPAMQSKLADLFADIRKKYKYNVIVETHSEYMIRRTQALIASGEIEFRKNPFRVYCFSREEGPKDMKYTPKGFFEESFDPGFYDTASELTLTVLKGKRV